MIHVITFVTQVTPPDNALYAYGPLGIGVVFLAIALYKLFNVILNDRDKAIQQRDALLEQIFTKVIPALNLVTEYLEDRKGIDKEFIQASKDSSETLRQNKEVLNEVLIILRSGRTGGS